VPAKTFSEVKFKKENVEEVMMELPEFNFYEIKEPAPNPYKGCSLDRSIVLDPKEAALVPPKFEFSKLENGLKIASVDKQGLTAHLGLFVSAGSRFETAANFGVSHMVELMSYRSTAHLSHLRTVKTLEQLGCNATAACKAGREEMVYKVETMREYVPLVLPLMIGNVLFPRLLPWEVKAASKLVKGARAHFEKDPDAMVSELLHKAAFCNNTLGFSPSARERCMPYFTPDTIRSFLIDSFAPERMVLVGVNVAHAELSKWAMRSFVDYNAIPMKKREEAKAVYTAGDVREEGASPFCHLAVAMESAPSGLKELAPFALLQTLLGSASASSSLPGSGVTGRLATQVVQQSPYVESCAAFNTSYTDSGLFGVYGVSQADKAGGMATAITKALAGLSTVSADELKLAKAMLKGKLLREADDSSALVQDLGSQILATGTYGSAPEFAAIVEKVDASEVTAAAKTLLAKKPTVAAFGDTHAVPHYAAIEASLKGA
jgi:processing peptidase subunit alpha